MKIIEKLSNQSLGRLEKFALNNDQASAAGMLGNIFEDLAECLLKS